MRARAREVRALKCAHACRARKGAAGAPLRGPGRHVPVENFLGAMAATISRRHQPRAASVRGVRASWEYRGGRAARSLLRADSQVAISPAVGYKG